MPVYRRIVEDRRQNMFKETIGVVGGFGGFATLNFFKRLLEEFSSDNERNIPHILMDNDFTMPSRTRALLYGESYEDVVNGIARSLELMCENDVDHIVLPCGTAHYFLEDVYKIIPQAEDRVLNIIDTLGQNLASAGVGGALILAAEGTLKQHVFPDKLAKHGISCVEPEEKWWTELRFFIECVKKNSYSVESARRFTSFLNGFEMKDVVLGCTEFPVFLDYAGTCGDETIKNALSNYRFWDPLEVTIAKLKEIIR